MVISFVTSEFNPFHNGHLKPLIFSKENLKADYCIAIMSGDYVQRGEPALFSKYARTKAALSAGYDMVIELPIYGCLSTSQIFSEVAIKTMVKTGIASHFVFGAENDNINIFNNISSYLSKEPQDYIKLLKKNQSMGMTFPKARSEALSTLLQGSKDYIEIREFLSSPNNILGLDYCLAAIKNKTNLVPVPIKREGGDYHESSVLSFSAESIRKYIRKNINHPFSRDFSDLENVMPPSVAKIIIKELQDNKFLTWDDFSALLLTNILTLQNSDSSSDLMNRIKNLASSYSSPVNFIENIKTKNITYSTVSRVLLGILLGLDNNIKSSIGCLRPDYPDYIRILGFRNESSDLLSLMKKKASVPLVVNPLRDSTLLTGFAKNQFEYSQKTSEIWRAAAIIKSKDDIPNEFQTKYPVKI